ncbi:MAG: hypothetical protein QXT73_00510 [Candidatus Methanomethylicaceae archaeon]
MRITESTTLEDRISTLKQIFANEEVITKIAEKFDPRLVVEDENGHCDQIHLKVHKSVTVMVNHLFTELRHKFNYRSEIIRSALEMGLVIMTEMITENKEKLNRLNKLLDEINSLLVTRELEKKKKYLQSLMIDSGDTEYAMVMYEAVKALSDI